MLNINLEKEPNFQENVDLKVGHMRCDFADGGIANSWFPTELASDSKVDLHEIQKVVNLIMFDEITTFDKVVELCGGRGYDNRTNMYVHVGNYNYRVDMIPVMGDYNYYIHVYCKETA